MTGAALDIKPGWIARNVATKSRPYRDPVDAVGISDGSAKREKARARRAGGCEECVDLSPHTLRH